MSFQAIRAWRTDLARYANAEYGSPEASWILARLEARRPRRRREGRLHLLRRRSDRRDTLASTPIPEAKSAPLEGPLVGSRGGGTRAACDHPDLEFLGNGGPTTYYRCTLCGRVVIQDRNSLFVLRPAEDTTDEGSLHAAAPAGLSAPA